jgi:hypothetical protein
VKGDYQLDAWRAGLVIHKGGLEGDSKVYAPGYLKCLSPLRQSGHGIVADAWLCWSRPRLRPPTSASA